MSLWLVCVSLLAKCALSVNTYGQIPTLDPTSDGADQSHEGSDDEGLTAPSSEYDSTTVINEHVKYYTGSVDNSDISDVKFDPNETKDGFSDFVIKTIRQKKERNTNVSRKYRDANISRPGVTSNPKAKFLPTSKKYSTKKDYIQPDESYLDSMQADYGTVTGTKGKTGVGGRANRKKNRKRISETEKVDWGDYSNEYRIKQKLIMYYDKTTRPVRNDSTTTDLYIGMSLYHILDTNEKFQTLSALIAIRLRWMDEYLRWSPSEYGGLTSIWIPAMRIWVPDIFINNFADDSFQDFMDTYAIVQHTGEVLWMFPAVVKTYCTLDVRHFPFDHQKCDIMFISWTFHGFKLNVTYNETENNAIYYKPKNQEWYVDQVTVARHEAIYACCIEPYPDVTFTIHMTRRSLFYIINLIFPCLLIYAVSFLGFFLPVESGEKVNLEITILLALVVFLLIVGETLPPTPDAIPALGLLFGLTMIMVSIALVMAVVVTNIFLRKDSGKRVPRFFRQIFLRAISRRNSLTNKITVAENHVNENNKHGPHLDIELDNLSVLSEIETLTCKNRNHRRKSGMSRSPVPPMHISAEIHDDPNECFARYAIEWQKLARTVDQIFFWLFLLASIGALTAVFAQVPSFRAT